jgi:glucose-1-phosphate adenylyltransferase
VQSVLSVILGGGQGSRLFPLTKYRSKPAVPIGAKYRLIDIPISNCLHSGLERIFVLTQFNSASLNRHVTQTYRFDAFSNGFVEILAAEQTQDNTGWYQGTADAVRQQLRHMVGIYMSEVLVLSGDHLYRMDYRPFVEEHRRKGADLTIAVKPVTREAAPNLGILKVGEDGRIVDFREKPKTDAELDELQIDPPAAGNPEEVFLASMGIYVFRPEVMKTVLTHSDDEDFGKQVIPGMIDSHKVYAHSFSGYWEDIGTIRAFFEANLMLTEHDPQFSFYRPGSPIYTHQRFLSASKLDGCRLEKCKIGEGSQIIESEIVRALVGIRSVIGPEVRISNTVMMGADYYESEEQKAENAAQGIPNVGIGSNCVIDGAIIDKNARIGAGARITNAKGLLEAEEDNHVIRDGIVVIPKDAVLPDGSVI